MDYLSVRAAIRMAIESERRRLYRVLAAAVGTEQVSDIRYSTTTDEEIRTKVRLLMEACNIMGDGGGIELSERIVEQTIFDLMKQVDELEAEIDHLHDISLEEGEHN